MNYRSRGYTIFTIANYIWMSILALLCIMPLIHVLALSFSNSWAATANVVTFLPVDPTFVSYKHILSNIAFLQSLQVGVIRTLLGTTLSMVLILLAAYSLSKNDNVFRGRTVYAWYFVFPMLFSGGLIPTYLIVQQTGLLDTIWALIIPGAVNIWILILMLNFFRTIPKDLEEAAYIDGAGHIVTLFRVYLPISKPGIATMTLFTLVFHWNSWFDGLIYIFTSDRYPLATFLRSIIVQEDFSKISIATDAKSHSERTLKAAQIFVGTLPILMVYPFLQKYFVKGIVLGSVKE